MPDKTHPRPTPAQPNMPPPSAEDPDTAAARKELKQTAISEKARLSSMPASELDEPVSVSASGATSGRDKAAGQAETHAGAQVDAQPGKSKDQMSSPTKKRGHDEMDEPKATAGHNRSSPWDRATHSEPEFKHHRDSSDEAKTDSDQATSQAESHDDEPVDRQSGKMKDDIPSPKKKRGHDEFDEPKDAGSDAHGHAPAAGANGHVSGNRTTRLEPEKKRHRDTSDEIQTDSNATTVSMQSPNQIFCCC